MGFVADEDRVLIPEAAQTGGGADWAMSMLKKAQMPPPPGMSPTGVPLKGFGEAVGELATGPNIGQAAGSLAGLIPGVGPFAKLALNIIGQGIGRAGGSAITGEGSPLVEGAVGSATAAVPAALAGGKHVVDVLGARASEQGLVKKFLEGVSSLLPAGTPRLSTSFPELRDQLSDTGPGSLTKYASKRFGDQLKALGRVSFPHPTNPNLRVLFEDKKIHLPSISNRDIRAKDAFDLITTKRPLTYADEDIVVSKQGKSSPKVPSRQRLIDEMEQSLQGPGLEDIMPIFAQMRGDMNKIMSVQRLLTAGSGKMGKVLNIDTGKIDLPSLQREFQKISMGGPYGGMSSFGPSGQLEMERILGRGSRLAGIDKPMSPAAIRYHLHSGTRPSFFGFIPSIPKAAGVNYQPPSTAMDMLLPLLLGSKAGEATR